MLKSHLNHIWWLNPIIWWLNHLKSHFILISHGKNGKIPIFPILWWFNQLNPIKKSLGHWAKSCLLLRVGTFTELCEAEYLASYISVACLRTIRGWNDPCNRGPYLYHICTILYHICTILYHIYAIYTIFMPFYIHWCGENDDKPW
jgi:hypothetical protein